MPISLTSCSCRRRRRRWPQNTAVNLRSLVQSLSGAVPVGMEDLERRLTVAEEKLFAALMTATPDEALYQVRADADRISRRIAAR